MKTTVDIADSILTAAKETARREGTTLRSLVEEGLRLSLDRRKAAQEGESFRLRDASVAGEGPREDLKGASWEQLRTLAYEERGG